MLFIFWTVTDLISSLGCFVSFNLILWSFICLIFGILKALFLWLFWVKIIIMHVGTNVYYSWYLFGISRLLFIHVNVAVDKQEHGANMECF
jgi:hypothetical protein